MTHADRAHVSEYIMENVGNSVRVSVTLRMESRLFDPFFYLDASTPTPQESFLTANYKARVNSKIWKKRTKRVHQHQSNKIPRHEKVDYEERFRMVMDAEEQPFLTVTSEKKNERRKSLISLRRSSTNATITDQLSQAPDHDHLFKKLLIACCDSCRRRRASSAISNPEDSQPEPDNDDADDEDEEEPESFECNEQDKEHVHDLLANMYFNKMVLPHMEYVEDFVDFLIDAELNDLPVLKRACERYLCGELNLKKDLATSLILDLLFMSIVFHLPVMKSMTLSELSYPTRAQELADPEKLLEQDEYRSLDKRMRTLSDRNLIELIEQCAQFREQRLRVTSF
ncbi:unnamed protein product, partial [Mesorhabditis belari]|uniref:Uncharacterized protein n=1 Tax=Mesorhabditis belari TaxID=2138241 RepID=A0AAF3J318_9BILA